MKLVEVWGLLHGLRDDGGLGQGGGAEKWLYSGYFLKGALLMD